jgi:stearoyl-CoA desaturase (delta-9 desaturase)
LIKACSYLKLTKNLKVSPENRIEKARADMLLKASKEKLQTLTNYQEQMDKLHSEYEKLMVRLNEYYDTKRQLMELKRKNIKDMVENSELSHELSKRSQLVKTRWQAQKKQWLEFNRQLAFVPQTAH